MKKKHIIKNIGSAVLIGSVLMALLLVVSLRIRQIELGAEIAATGSGTSITDTGALLIEQQKTQERIRRANGFLLRIESRSEKRNTFATEDEERRLGRIEHRLACRNEINRAVGAFKFPTMLRCYRAQLTLHLEALRKERTYIQDTMAGLTDEIKKQALGEMDELIGAITAIIDGIDAGVYGSDDDLKEAKQNLTELYWKKWWRARTKLFADRMLSWTAHFIVQTDKKMGLAGENPVLLANVRACLTDEEEKLEAALIAPEYGETKQQLKEAYEQLPACLDRDNHLLIQQEEKVEQEEDENPMRIILRKEIKRQRYWGG